MRGTWVLVLALVAAGCDDDPDPASSAPPAEQDAAVADAAPQGCDDPVEVCPDEDGDGRGDPDRVQRLCEVPAGFVAVCDDCDDRRREAKPGRPSSATPSTTTATAWPTRGSAWARRARSAWGPAARRASRSAA
ncbi:MAG: hypothetical protein R3F43_28270 [bacterium]